MKFSTRTLYGLRAVLALAGRFGEGSLSVSQIAKQEAISTGYLEQILNALKRKGLVKSVRGPQGGYVLNQKPSDISLGDLFCQLEGKNFFPTGVPRTISADSSETAVADFIFWKKFESLLETGFSGVSLKELVDEARRIKKTKSVSPQATFHI